MMADGNVSEISDSSWPPPPVCPEAAIRRSRRRGPRAGRHVHRALDHRQRRWRPAPQKINGIPG